ncbi:MAG: DUF3089 domain-containing protein [Bacteroidota bacterium]
MYKYALLFCCLMGLTACKTYRPQGPFQETAIPQAPDYSKASAWAALPSTDDMADRTPDASLIDRQSEAPADVFFLTPTTYTGSKKWETQWNGPIDDPRLNKKTDEGTILHQASIFNGAGRVFAPRYRQAHLHAYFTKAPAAKTAFELAYKDVVAAFEYYLEHHNDGRPIIIAAHSQGTTHAAPLIKAYFDGKARQNQLIAAYLVGMPIAVGYFDQIPACETPEQVNCFCSWRTWQKGYLPPSHDKEQDMLVTNPLLWTTDTTYAAASFNKGTVLRKFKRGFKKGITDAQVHQNVLWVNKPKFFGSALINFKNYHIADYNLFYVNIRENARRRVESWLSKYH